MSNRRYIHSVANTYTHYVFGGGNNSHYSYVLFGRKFGVYRRPQLKGLYFFGNYPKIGKYHFNR